MKKYAIIILLLLFVVGSAWAAIPQIISVQGKLTSASTGTPLTGSYQMNFSIYNVNTSGTILWTESQTVSVNSGIFNAYIGSTTTLNLLFNESYWLEIRIYNGSAWETLSPRQRLAAAPYAYSGSGWMLDSSTIKLISSASNMNAGALFINNTANFIGIGTTTPKDNLEVAGGILVSQGGIVTDTLKINDLAYNSVPSSLWIGDSDGNLLSCDNSGVCINHGDKGDAIYASVVFDGRLWLFTYTRHLLSCDSTGACIDHGVKGTTDVQYHTMKVFNGKIGIGTKNNLSYCDSSGVCVVTKNVSASTNYIQSMVVYAGKLWLGMGSGNIVACDASSNCVTYSGNGGAGDAIDEMTVYDGKLWLGTWYGNIYSCNSSGGCSDLGDKGEGIFAMTVFNKKLWISDVNGNISSCDTNGSCTNYGRKLADSIYSMVVYDGKLWLGGGAGNLTSCDTSGTCTLHGDKGGQLQTMEIFNPTNLGNVLYTNNGSNSVFIISGAANYWFNATGFYCSGGSCVKQAVFETARGESVGYNVIESPVVELTLSGSSQLKNGVAKITFGYPFNESLSDKVPIRVLITPTVKCAGLYVEKKSMNGFTVKKADICPDDTTFDWMAIGRRIHFGPGENGVDGLLKIFK